MITGVVLARDEELNIVACLQALRPHVAELILIDMESQDRTVELSRPLVDRIISHPVIANFDSARNVAIPEASHDWLWFVDADELIPPQTGRAVSDLVRTQGNEFEALNIPFKTFFCGHWMEHNGWWPGYTCCRVLKRGHFEFARWLHGGVQVAGRVLYFPASPETAIVHNSFRSLEHYVSKFNRYTTIEASKLYEFSTPYNWRTSIRAMMQDLWQHYEHFNACRDETWGWVVAWQAAQYRWMSSTKLLDELQRRGEAIPVSMPASLDEVLAAMEEELAGFRSREPVLPLGLVVRCEVEDLQRGWPTAAARIMELARLGRPMQWQHGVGNEPRPQHESLDPLIWTLETARRPGHAITICFAGRTLPEPDARSILSVCWLLDDEYDFAAPQDVTKKLSRFDSVWVSSPPAARNLRSLGLAQERIQVVPPWFDSQRFATFAMRRKLPPANASTRRLLVILGEDAIQRYRSLLDTLDSLRPKVIGPVALQVAVSFRGGGNDQLDEQLLQVHADHSASRDGWAVMNLLALSADVERQLDLLSLTEAVMILDDSDLARSWTLAATGCGLPVSVSIPNRLSGSNGAIAGAIPSHSDGLPQSRSGEWGYEPTTENGALDQANGESVSLGLQRILAMDNNNNSRELRSQTQRSWGDATVGKTLKQVIENLEGRIKVTEPTPVRPEQLRVVLEGELFAGHSFANINEVLAEKFNAESSLALRIERCFYQSTQEKYYPDAKRFEPLLKRHFPNGPEITIRHAFPPKWDPPAQGLWIHIQPWEFGYLPNEWIRPLREQVTEIWAPSEYVRNVYIASGIPASKIQVMPWGIDPEVFSPEAPPRNLPTTKSFRFLFVGGSIPRKGFDRLLQAYCAEFRKSEDVCLVIKDLGSQSFYQDTSLQHQVFAAINNQNSPAIIYLSGDFLPSQLASLYTACHCLVAPYRGEGFGLPILEGMASGLPPIVPLGGPTDDFVSDETGYRLPSRQVLIPEMQGLCAPGLEFEVSESDLRQSLRQAFEQREEVRQRGVCASRQVRNNWTWNRSVALMVERLWYLAETHLAKSRTHKQAAEISVKLADNIIPVEGTKPHSSTELITPHFPLPEQLGTSPKILIAQPSPFRTVLIQMGTGPHEQLLRMAEAHHASYAARHGMDYWGLTENPVPHKRPGWGKIRLLLQAFEAGYQQAIWLDTDAVVTRPEINLAVLCDHGIALVQHPNPVHWNTGFMVAVNSPLVRQFLSEIHAQPDNDSAWMEQLAFNQLIQRPEYRALLTPLSPTFNSTPGAITVSCPVIQAAHGLPHEKRIALMTEWLRDSGKFPEHEVDNENGLHIRVREEFADHLNLLGLTNEAVEVGVLRGKFSQAFLDRWRGQCLHLVDPWRQQTNYVDVANSNDEEQEQCLAEVHRRMAVHAGRFQIHRQLSVEAAVGFSDASLDFVYIDANHEYEAVRADLQAWYSKVRPGGILAGHDFVDGLYRDGEFGVRSALNELEMKTGIKVKLTTDDHSTSWYLYRL